MDYKAISVKDWLDQESQPGEPRISDEFLTGWVVLEGKIPRFSRRMTETEARIIEFAFSALRNHQKLIAIDPDEFERVPSYVSCESYTGPTDGVVNGADE